MLQCTWIIEDQQIMSWSCCRGWKHCPCCFV